VSPHEPDRTFHHREPRLKPLGLWTLPNAITWYRVAAAVPIILLLVNGSNAALWAALGLMVIAEVSDGVDGWVARRTGQVSAVGKILDPMADSLYRVSVFTAFAANRWMPVWMLIVMAAREIAQAHLRIVAESHIGTMAARWSGKIKAAAQGLSQLGITFLFAFYAGAPPESLIFFTWLLLFVTTALSVWSFFDYVWLIYSARSARKAVQFSKQP